MNLAAQWKGQPGTSNVKQYIKYMFLYAYELIFLLYVQKKKSHKRRYGADHFIVQASKAWFIDINQALNKLHIWYGITDQIDICISIFVAFWTKITYAKKLACITP